MTSQLLVVTVATHENPGVVNFETSCKIFGYKYKILCKGEQFRGWGWRTQKYIDAIHQYTSQDDDIILLCDSNDVYFIGPPEELISKFKSMNKRIVMGAEPACCNGKYSDRSIRHVVWNRMKEYFPDSRYRYPNAGILIGYRNDLIPLLESNKNEPDDQGGFLQKLMDDQNRFGLDWETQIVGNFPTMTDWHRDPWDNKSKTELDHWTIDYQRKRIKNIGTGHEPLILHFAGSNWSHYNKIAELIFSGSLKPKGGELRRIRPNTYEMLKIAGMPPVPHQEQVPDYTLIIVPIVLFVLIILVAAAAGIYFVVVNYKASKKMEGAF